jgi:cytochrome c oxidase subunit 1
MSGPAAGQGEAEHGAHEAHGGHGEGHGHAPKGFISTYVFSTDHKMIGKQFLFTTLFFFLVGGLLALGVRFVLAWPGKEMPVIGKLFFTGGVPQNENYNMMFTMHASVMIFMVIIPILNGAFANFLIPLQIGCDDMAFPRLNMLSYWAFWPAAACFIASFFVKGGASGGGWTGYPPLSDLPGAQPAELGMTLWTTGVFFIGLSSIMGAVNYATTIIKMRAPGMSMFRMPLTTWALFINAILALFATPVLGAAMLLLTADKVLGTSFFTPGDQWITGTLIERAGGGHVILFQHLFWFYSHPAVYIMILPAMGITSDILATFARKPIFGYKPMVYSICAIAGLGFIVWAHHMFQSGMNPGLAMAFMVSTMMIALPSAIKTFNWLGTLWGGQIRFTTAMLNALAFVSMFIIGGLSGIFMAATPVDMHIHDTYYIVGHIHYVLFGGSTFAIFAGIYYWFPKMFGRFMNETWGKIHFVLSFLLFNGVFFTMHILGAGGMPRRIANPYNYSYLQQLQPMNEFMTWCAFGLGAVQILLLVNMFWSMKHGKPAGKNPWNANGLEWVAPSPPPHGNFETVPNCYRGPYEYSVPGRAEDFYPQDEPGPDPAAEGHDRPAAAGAPA